MYRPPSSSSSASSSSSSSHQHTSSLTRYSSAPGSLLTTAVDAVIASASASGGGSRLFPPGTGHYFSSDSTQLQRSSSSSSYDAFDGSALLRQKSSPAGFLNHLATHNHNAGFTITRGDGGQGQECLSRISENGSPSSYVAAANNSTWGGSDNSNNNNNNSNSIVFSSNNKRPRNDINNNNNDDDPDLLLHCLNALETQYSLPQTSLEMASVDKLLHIPQDSVPCKIRAKRGCATHPRSIAERERRTRISGKLKKLQDLVPNMDKQTSYSDMLDLAVQHIKGLQTQVQKLHGELENCSCGCKPST